MAMPIYWGVFLERDMPCALPTQVRNQHVTFGFRAEPPAGIPWGEEVNVEIVGYGNDGQNEGYLVVLTSEQLSVYDGAPYAHITIGLNGGKPKDTWKLHFEDIKPRTVKGRWGKFLGGEKPCYR